VLAVVPARPDLEFHMGSSPSFFSDKEAAAYLSVSLSTIRRWRRTSAGPAFFRFGGVLRYGREALEAFVAKNTNVVA
jgi:excisionase family DNA binding protein